VQNAPTSGASDDWARLLTGAGVALVDVAGRDVDNVAVTAVTVGDPLPLVHTPITVSTTIHNNGRQPRDDLPVSLAVGRAGDRGRPLQVAQKLVDVPANAAVTVTFSLDGPNQFREPGQYVLQVRAGEDSLALDDSRALALTVRDTIPVVVVNGKPSADPLDRASGFLTHALNPFPDGERSPDSPARVRVLVAREFQDAGLGDLFRPDAPTEVVFLADLPAIGGNEAARLEAHLKRGGSVVIGLGPNAARNVDGYNRVLFNDGKGLLPGPLVGVRRAEDGQFFTLFTDDDTFREPPLAAFRSEQERASFSTPRFGRYVRLDVPPNGPARRLFSFLPSDRRGQADRLDPAVVEWPRHRGRVIVFASSLNTDWNEWPRTLSFAPFVQELLRFAVAPATRQTVQVGESIEEYVPTSFVGLTATATPDDGPAIGPIPVESQDQAGLVRLPAVARAGIYRLSVGGRHESVFAVNVPVVSPTGGAESDLRRLTAADFQSTTPDADLQVVGDVSEVKTRAAPVVEAGGPVHVSPRGPAVARILLFAVVGLLVLEMVLAWRYGSARAGATADPARVRPSRWLTPLWVVPLIVCIVAVGVAIHAAVTGDFLGFLPGSVRQPLEQHLGVPAAPPGEGTRWRLESLAYLTGDSSSDRWLVASLLALAAVFVWRLYRRERPGPADRPSLPWWRHPLARLGALRFALLGLVLAVLLPQVRLAFEREGWPDVVIVFDDSRSMAVVDTFQDPTVRERADELKQEWAKLAGPRIDALRRRAEEVRRSVASDPESMDAVRARDELAEIDARIRDLETPHRLNLIKAMLASQDGEWLESVVGGRQMRVHVIRVSGQITHVAELDDPAQCRRLLDELMDVVPSGESSRLGSGVTDVLKTFRGRSLNAIVLFTDGVNTAGEDLPTAARNAGRAGVPLYLVGVGDAADPPDVALSDLKAEESVQVNDRLVIEARATAQGPGMPESVPVTLSEIKNGLRVEVGRETVRLDPTGKPVRVRFVHQPKEAGEKTFVIEIPTPANDTDHGNNRLEHRVHVAEAKRLRVLLVEGRPRYDYRFVKALFERESDGAAGTRSIDVTSYLVSAHPDHPRQDRTSINRFPTPEELRTYDVVVFGDVSPRDLPRSEAAVDSLAKYVKVHGGGLLLLAGEEAMPHAYRETPLADVLPVVIDGPAPAVLPPKDGFRPRLTPGGQSHPLFRFSTEAAENAEIWNRLPPLHWYARGYRRKLAAEVLAVHPDRPAEAQPGSAARDENHPLVLQQFVGAGRVLFIGFDDTWRWRLRQDEVRFNQFWIQAVRSLARGRVGRVEVRTDRKTYRRDEPIRITVQFPDDAPPPEGPVRVTIDRAPPAAPGGPPSETESQTIQLAPREGARATFEAIVTRTPEGDYAFSFAGPAAAGGQSRAEARVLPPPGELDRIQLNESDLQRAARESHGQYYPLDRADRVPEELPSGPRVALDQPVEPL
jgi:hypothetical protein